MATDEMGKKEGGTNGCSKNGDEMPNSIIRVGLFS